MIQGFINGIKNMIGSVGNAISGIANKVKSFLHFSRPDEGPLREYEKWMPDMVDGLAKTLQKRAPRLYNATKELAKKMSDELDFDKIHGQMQTAVAFETGKISTTLSTNANINKMLQAKISVQGDTYLDSTKVGRIIAPEVTKNIRTAGG